MSAAGSPAHSPASVNQSRPERAANRAQNHPAQNRPVPAHDRRGHAGIVAALALTLLAAMGVCGYFWWRMPDIAQQNQVVSRMGPAFNLAPLPTIRMEMGGIGGLALDLTLALVLEPGAKPAAAAPYVDRFIDRMGDRLRDVGLEQLNGAKGALLVKEIARSLAQQEFRKSIVRDVLIQEMLLRTPYSAAPGGAMS